MTIRSQRGVPDAHQRVATAVAGIQRDLGAGPPGARPDIRRRVKQLIALLARMAPDWGAGEPARAQLRAAALSGVLALAGAIDQPGLSNALREAALRQLTPDGA